MNIRNTAPFDDKTPIDVSTRERNTRSLACVEKRVVRIRKKIVDLGVHKEYGFRAQGTDSLAPVPFSFAADPNQPTLDINIHYRLRRDEEMS